MIAGQLDAKRDTIQHDLDEAARIRAEAERLLAELKAERVEAEAQVRGMLAAAEEQARAYEAEAKVRLEESLVRRQMLAERRISPPAWPRRSWPTDWRVPSLIPWWIAPFP